MTARKGAAERLRALGTMATSGPWHISRPTDGGLAWVEGPTSRVVWEYLAAGDAHFIVTARNTWDALADVVDETTKLHALFSRWIADPKPGDTLDFTPLEAALAALDEALDKQGGGA